MRRVPKPMTSRAGGRPKSPYKPKTAFKKGHKAVYAKVRDETEESLPRKTYKQLYKLRKPPADKKERRKLGQQFVVWAFEEDNLILEEFPIQHGITPKSFRLLAKSDPEFGEYFDIGKAALGARRERLVGRELFKAMHPMYNDAWSDYLDTKQDKDSKSSPSTITVITNSAERTDVVPEKKH
jgi:hypothetical protein